jgi:hypothetical protein
VDSAAVQAKQRVAVVVQVVALATMIKLNLVRQVHHRLLAQVALEILVVALLHLVAIELAVAVAVQEQMQQSPRHLATAMVDKVDWFVSSTTTATALSMEEVKSLAQQTVVPVVADMVAEAS